MYACTGRMLKNRVPFVVLRCPIAWKIEHLPFVEPYVTTVSITIKIQVATNQTVVDWRPAP